MENPFKEYDFDVVGIFQHGSQGLSTTNRYENEIPKCHIYGLRVS